MKSLAEAVVEATTKQTTESFETGVQSEGAALALIIGSCVFSIVWGIVNIVLVSYSKLTSDQQSRYGKCRRLHEQK